MLTQLQEIMLLMIRQDTNFANSATLASFNSGALVAVKDSNGSPYLLAVRLVKSTDLMLQDGAKQLADAEDQLEAALDAALDMDFSEGSDDSLEVDTDEDGGPPRHAIMWCVDGCTADMH